MKKAGRAVELALNQHIQAVCFTDRDSLDNFLNNPPPNTVSFMTKSMPCKYFASTFQNQLALAPISSKFTAPWPLKHLLAGVYVAESMAEAIQHTKQLKSYESIITREGICIGTHWIHLTANADHKAGLLQRVREIAQLQKTLQDFHEQLNKKQIHSQCTQKQLKELEDSQALQQKHHTELIAQQADLSARQTVQHARLNQATQRIQAIQQELQEIKQVDKTTQTKLQQTCEEQKNC